MFLRQITLFEQRTTLADFEGYPLSIRQFISIERKLSEQGSLAQAPLLEFILQVTDVVVQPDPRDALVIEDGDSYYDYDRSIGWIIGQGKPQTPGTRS